MTLYQRIGPFLRTENPKTAAEAEGKTDFICDALRKALKLGGHYRRRVQASFKPGQVLPAISQS